MSWWHFMWSGLGKPLVKTSAYSKSYPVHLQSLSTDLLREKRKQQSWVLNPTFPKAWQTAIIVSFFYRLFHTSNLFVFLDWLLITVPVRMIPSTLPTFSLQKHWFFNSVVLRNLVQPLRTTLSATACMHPREMPLTEGRGIWVQLF